MYRKISSVFEPVIKYLLHIKATFGLCHRWSLDTGLAVHANKADKTK